MSNTQEYYIRNASETEARGPFNQEQLISLAENGQVDPDTFYYDAGAEAWTLVSGNAELMATLFPAKKILRVKAKGADQMKTLNTISEDERAITVDDMLLAAEGRTEDTKDSADPAILQSRAASLGSYAVLAMLLFTGAAYALPHIDVLIALDFAAIFAAPLVILGLFNLVLAICILLGAVSTYPLIRFAAMLGVGFAGTLFHLNDQPTLALATLATGVGIYFCTILLNLWALILFASVGLLGALVLAKHFLVG
jgi:hypothetical protein